MKGNLKRYLGQITQNVSKYLKNVNQIFLVSVFSVSLRDMEQEINE
jgi:hypothetical protein